MPFISGEGGGASVAAPLTLTSPAPGTPTLHLISAAGEAGDVFLVEDNAGVNLFELDAVGDVLFQSGSGSCDFLIQSQAGSNNHDFHTTNGYTFNKASVRVAGITTNGGLLTALHAAPADAELSNGDCVLWFDQTNGVGNTKLMVKAKS